MLASVDGFRKGWIIAKAEKWPSDAPIQFVAVPTFSRVLAETKHCSSVVVDMPIGMPHGSEMRTCDRMTRDAFPALARSIFRTPPRPSLIAKTPIDFRKLVKELTTEDADFAAWSIVPKLREVDAVMAANTELQERIREFHPELTWRRLAGSLLCSKRSGVGILQRTFILNEVNPGWFGKADPKLPKAVAADDILDAVIGLSVAEAISRGTQPLYRYPKSEPEKDEYGLRMEMWY